MYLKSVHRGSETLLLATLEVPVEAAFDISFVEGYPVPVDWVYLLKFGSGVVCLVEDDELGDGLVGQDCPDSAAVKADEDDAVLDRFII